MNDTSLLRTLGNSDIQITPIGLGTWQFSKRKNLPGKFWPSLSEEESHTIVHTSYNEGINWFDTAELYGGGESERTLARALQSAGIKDSDVVIATKWSPFFRFARTIRTTIDDRQKALDGYTISLHQIHNPMSFASIQNQMKAMADLVSQDKIKYVGVSNFSAEQMRKAYHELKKYGCTLVSNQVHYNLLQRNIENNGILDTAKELGISIIAYSPLAQGILTGKYHDNPESIKSKKGFRKRMGAFKQSGLEKTRPLVEKLQEIAQNHEATPAQVSLSWLINFHGHHVFAIPGASNARQAESNAKAMRLELSYDEKRELDEESKKL